MVSVTFKGGDKLKSELAKILRKAKNARSVDIGFMGGSTEADGTPVPLVAALNEYGAPSRGQPPRSFFRNMIANNKDGWGRILAGAMKGFDNDAERSLGLLGQEVQEQLQDSIRELKSPPLAPSTIARKGFAKPLIDTSTMLRSVTHKVNK